jgi:hypothetical protein
MKLMTHSMTETSVCVVCVGACVRTCAMSCSSEVAYSQSVQWLPLVGLAPTPQTTHTCIHYVHLASTQTQNTVPSWLIQLFLWTAVHQTPTSYQKGLNRSRIWIEEDGISWQSFCEWRRENTQADHLLWQQVRGEDSRWDVDSWEQLMVDDDRTWGELRLWQVETLHSRQWPVVKPTPCLQAWWMHTS